jgi:hypothetical protein
MTTEPSALPDLSRETSLERLQHKPIIDLVDERTLTLITKQIAPDCTHAEVGHFLELCAHYDLDPFAHEAWCAKSEGGRLLIMTGRDGLRKIAQRNGLHVDCDVVREHDELSICRTPDGNRTVAHSYTNMSERGEVVGAWAEVRQGGPTGTPKGYFYAPLSEFMPSPLHPKSVWAKQVSIMILAAAERQAIRQATPLGGLLVYGEDELVSAYERADVTAATGSGETLGLDLPPAVEELMALASELGHAAYADRASIEMIVGGQSGEFVDQWVANAHDDLDQLEKRREAESVTVEPPPAESAPVEPSPDVQEADVVDDLQWAAMRTRREELAGMTERSEDETTELAQLEEVLAAESEADDPLPGQQEMTL